MIHRLLMISMLALGVVLSLAPGAQARSSKWAGGPFHAFTSFKGGAFLPKDSTLKSLYGKAGYFLSARVGVLAEHDTFGVRGGWTLPGTLAFSVEGGFYRVRGREVSAPYPELKLYILPVTFGLEWAARFSEEQFLVPYAGVGYGAAYFHDSTYTVPAQKVDGVRFGFSAEAGLRLHLDRFDRAAERSFKGSVGVTNTFVDFRARYQSINGFDTGIDLSGLVLDGGLTFEF